VLGMDSAEAEEHSEGGRKGTLRGREATSVLGERYYSFQGIPYAQAASGSAALEDKLILTLQNVHHQSLETPTRLDMAGFTKVLVLLAVAALVMGPTEAQKPGRCPPVRPGQVGVCAELCTGDNSCSGNSKCCSNGCGHSCQRPVYKSSDAARGAEVKPSDMAALARLLLLLAVSGLLAAGADAKPGSCPPVQPSRPGACVTRCVGDDHCPGRQKCCVYGCTASCKDP
ncbi:Uncharacterized protein GBIM_04728, partial [Gryllus bimaculatus]